MSPRSTHDVTNYKVFLRSFNIYYFSGMQLPYKLREDNTLLCSEIDQPLFTLLENLYERTSQGV